MIVERMTEADVADVLAIETASFRESRARIVREEEREKKPTRSGRLDGAQLREELARPWARIWVARGDAPAGAPRAVAFLLAWHVADELHVLDVATHPELRRQGYGRALMQQSLAYAREHAVRHVLLEVRRSNMPAIRLYRDCGFFAMGVRKSYYADGEDAVEMVLMLDERGEIQRRKDEVSV
ncbi:MAG TPA: GNAT family N-acetyltransferase [Polyangiaceae bacterium]